MGVIRVLQQDPLPVYSTAYFGSLPADSQWYWKGLVSEDMPERCELSRTRYPRRPTFASSLGAAVLRLQRSLILKSKIFSVAGNSVPLISVPFP